MNKLKFNFLIASVFSILIALLFIFGATASAEVRVSFYENASNPSISFIESGDSITLPSPSVSSGAVSYGWITPSGDIYSDGSSILIEQNTVFYRAFGCEISSQDDLKAAISSGYTYVRLGSDIEFNESFTLSSGLFVFDTNGYTASFVTDGFAFEGNDIGLIFTGNGVVNHSFPSADPNFVLDSFVSFNSSAICEHMFLTVCKSVTVNTNIGLASISENISRFDDAFSIEIYGKLSCDRLLRTAGVKNASVKVFDTAEINTSSEFLLDDISSTATNGINAILTVYGGSIYLDRSNGIAPNMKNYKVVLLGGRFSKDITGYFSDKNYSFTADNGMYRFNACTHDGPVFIPITVGCEDEVTVTYKCKYCDTLYDKYYKNGIGHTDTVSLHSECVTTEEETRPGYYKNECQKCGNVRYTPFYPNPSKVYVTVKYLDDKGESITVRVPSEELYTFDGTYLKSFGTEYVQDVYGAKQENIYYVELPLGTTQVYGNYKHEAGSGVFYRNDHITELILPQSLVNIDKYAFADMTRLEKLVGVEHISGTIGEKAFMQSSGALIYDHLTINATKLEKDAFRNVRMISVTFGENVSYIDDGAFGLNEGFDAIIEEVFVVGNETNDGATVSAVMGGRYNQSNQQFGSLPLVFLNHTYSDESFNPSCSSQGYVRHTCVRCNYYYDDAFVDPLEHDYEHILVPSTCVTYGYTADVCKACQHEKEGSRVQNMGTDKDNHDFTYGETIICKGYICEVSYYTLSTCICGAIEADTDENRSEVYAPIGGGAHEWDVENEKIIVQPTCGDFGTSVQTCTICGKEKTLSIAPNPDEHDWTNDPIVEAAPNCKNSGTLVYKCAVCSSERRTYPSPNPENHIWDEGRILTKPTTEQIGKIFYSCTLCDATRSEGLPKLPADTSMPTWLLILIIAVSVLLLAGVALAIYFTIFKKKRASSGYKYKFNTLGK